MSWVPSVATTAASCAAPLAAPLRLDIASALRPEISWPASLGICQKNQDDAAETSDTTRKAGANTSADNSVRCRIQSVDSTQNAPTATPAETASCWLTLTMVVARLIWLGSTSA